MKKNLVFLLISFLQITSCDFGRKSTQDIQSGSESRSENQLFQQKQEEKSLKFQSNSPSSDSRSNGTGVDLPKGSDESDFEDEETREQRMEERDLPQEESLRLQEGFDQDPSIEDSYEDNMDMEEEY